MWILKFNGQELMPLVISKDCQPAGSQGCTVAALPGGLWHLTLRLGN